MAVAGKQALPTSIPFTSLTLQTRLLHSNCPMGSDPGSLARNHKGKCSWSQANNLTAQAKALQGPDSLKYMSKDITTVSSKGWTAKRSRAPVPFVSASVTLGGQTRTGVLPHQPGAERDLPDSSGPCSMAPLFPACFSSPFPSQTALQFLPACKEITCDLSHNQ